MYLSKTKRQVLVATETITSIAVLIALSVVCSMFLTFRFGTFLKFSPSFIIIALAARRFNVYGAVIVAFMTDFIQYLMFPSNGFSIGICLSNVLTGVIFGLLFAKKINLKRITIATLSSQIICSLFITTLTMVYIERWFPLFPLLYFRLVQVVTMSVASIVLLYLLFIKIDIAKLTKIVK